MKTSMILNEISLITSELARDYPEIYRTLEEENFLGGASGTDITDKDLNSYLKSLKEIRDHYKENHQDTLAVYPARNLISKIIRRERKRA